ncbi:MAG: hypothetical protein PHV16_00935 [Candidatus Nanoarchaeia archaeon]|nr:hypothetical protein [Candidatus Nanoarchaeia archaeon]
MLLNEKRGCFSFLFFVPAVFVLPINPEVVFNILNFFFGSPGDDGTALFLKAGIWIILFALVFGVSSKMFDKKGIATIFSMVFSLISIRFIPNEYIHYIGQAYGILGIVFLVLFVIGATLFILNKYFPITEHKAFGFVWGLFYFFIAWCFHQLANLQLYDFPKIQEALQTIAPWGRVVSIVLGVACLMKALGGRSKYAREPSRRPERRPPERRPNPERREPERREPETPNEPQTVRIRSLTSLKEKYHNYVFNLFSGRSTEQRARRKRQRILQAMRIIVSQAERMGCPRDRFLHSRKQGGIGQSNFERPEVYEQRLRQRGLI